MEDRIVLSAPEVIVVSSPLRDAFISRGVDRAGSPSCPWPWTFGGFIPTSRRRICVRYGLNSRTIVGYTGTLTAWHGIELLFEVAERIKALEEGGDKKTKTVCLARITDAKDFSTPPARLAILSHFVSELVICFLTLYNSFRVLL
jgi:hypothetical protein